MSQTIPRLATVGFIAERFGVRVHQVEHVIETRGIEPVGRAGNAYIYSDDDVEFVGHELTRIAREREGAGHAA